MTALMASAVALMLAAAPSTTESAAVQAEEPPWPDGATGQMHYLIMGSFGPCLRPSSPIAAGGPCGEIAAALDFPVSWKSRFGLELGAALRPSVTAVDPDVTRSSGGPFFGTLRFLYQYDVFLAFFTRGGMQLRWTLFKDASNAHHVVLGTQGFLEVGTRVGRRVEFGIRSSAGVDGMWVTLRPHWVDVFAFDTSFVLRVRLW